MKTIAILATKYLLGGTKLINFWVAYRYSYTGKAFSLKTVVVLSVC